MCPTELPQLSSCHSSVFCCPPPCQSPVLSVEPRRQQGNPEHQETVHTASPPLVAIWIFTGVSYQKSPYMQSLLRTRNMFSSVFFFLISNVRFNKFLSKESTRECYMLFSLGCNLSQYDLNFLKES